MKSIINKTPHSPEELGYNPEQLEKIDLMFRDMIKKDQIQCASYTLSRHGKVFASRGLGPLTGESYEDQKPMRPDSIRMIASVTKVFTATAIMQLVEEGKAVLEARVTPYLPEFENDLHRYITMQELITHTSGLRSDPGAYLEPYASGPGCIDNPNLNWIEKVLTGPLENKPGTTWGYSSHGFVILAELVSRISGMPYEEYVVEKICKPLGLYRTFFDVPEDLKEETCYVFPGEKERTYTGWKNGEKPPRGGGGLFSTAEDLDRFARMFLNKGKLDGVKILSRKGVEFMTRNQLDNIASYNWTGEKRIIQQGLGWRICGPAHNLTSPSTYKHEGAGGSGLYVDPEKGLVMSYFVPFKDWTQRAVFAPVATAWAGLE